MAYQQRQKKQKNDRIIIVNIMYLKFNNSRKDTIDVISVTPEGSMPVYLPSAVW